MQLVHQPSPVKVARQTKDDAEIARIEAAAACADGALAEVEPNLCGMTEAEVRMELEYQMRLHGADDRSYDTIVASGPDHGARPHHGASGRTIVEGDTVIIDVGALVDGYHSDMTRSWVIGERDRAAARDLRARGGRPAGRARRRRGRASPPRTSTRRVGRCSSTPATATGSSTEPVTASASTSTSPRSIRRRAPTCILDGNVVTVEPGLYRGGFGGFRIEDLVLVTEPVHGTGHRVLTHSPKRELN